MLLWATFCTIFSCLLQLITGTLRKTMASGNPSDPHASDPHASKQETDFLLCCICQLDTSEKLIETPKTYQKPLDDIRELATYGEKDFPATARRLSHETADTLRAQGATWHRSCYISTTNKTVLNRAKERFEKQILRKARRVDVDTEENSPSTSDKAFTRSKSTPFDQTVCFFCDERFTKYNPSIALRTDKAGKNLHDAI